MQMVVIPQGSSVKDIVHCRIRLMDARGTACFQRVMLERGTDAPDWVCAPEDELNHLELKLSAQINTSADSIRQEVQAKPASASWQVVLLYQPRGRLAIGIYLRIPLSPAAAPKRKLA